MIKTTRDYDKFKFRDDNREAISQPRVEDLIKKIQKKNLLHLNPIIINDKWEVINGQHRVLAAKKLGLEIYYIQDNAITPGDIATINDVKSWKLNDYLNFYVKNGYPEYIKLNEFIKRHNISLKVAFNVARGRGRKALTDFMEGKYVHDSEMKDEYIEICHELVEFLRQQKGKILSTFTTSAKFWQAVSAIAMLDKFDRKHFIKNCQLHHNKIMAKASLNDYIRLFQWIYNYRLTEDRKIYAEYD